MYSTSGIELVDEIEKHILSAGLEPNTVLLAADAMNELVADIDQRGLWDDRSRNPSIGDVLLVSPEG